MKSGLGRRPAVLGRVVAAEFFGEFCGLFAPDPTGDVFGMRPLEFGELGETCGLVVAELVALLQRNGREKNRFGVA